MRKTFYMNIQTWEDFDKCISFITLKFKNKDFSGVYGFPRGGLCIAVALSHSLNIPLLNEPENYSLIIDDIYQTGSTIKAVRHLRGIEVMVWISKVNPTWWNAYKIINNDEWVVFPWEDLTNAEKEKDSYYKSRKKLFSPH